MGRKKSKYTIQESFRLSPKLAKIVSDIEHSTEISRASLFRVAVLTLAVQWDKVKLDLRKEASAKVLNGVEPNEILNELIEDSKNAIVNIKNSSKESIIQTEKELKKLPFKVNKKVSIEI